MPRSNGLATNGYVIVEPTEPELRLALARRVKKVYGGDVSVDYFLGHYRTSEELADKASFRFLAHLADLIAEPVAE